MILYSFHQTLNDLSLLLPLLKDQSLFFFIFSSFQKTWSIIHGGPSLQPFFYFIHPRLNINHNHLYIYSFMLFYSLCVHTITLCLLFTMCFRISRLLALLIRTSQGKLGWRWKCWQSSSGGNSHQIQFKLFFTGHKGNKKKQK